MTKVGTKWPNSFFLSIYPAAPSREDYLQLNKNGYEMTKIVWNDLGMKWPGYEMTGYALCVVEHVCHHFQEEQYAYPWTIKKISYVPCLRILLPAEQYAKGDWHITPHGSYMQRQVRIELPQGYMRMELYAVLHSLYVTTNITTIYSH